MKIYEFGSMSNIRRANGGKTGAILSFAVMSWFVFPVWKNVIWKSLMLSFTIIVGPPSSVRLSPTGGFGSSA